MENIEHEYESDVLPKHVEHHLRQVALQKATDKLNSDEVQSLCDRINEAFQDVERGQTYPINTFK